MKMVDLFAGIGGFTLGCQQAGMECVYASDNDEKCQVTYERNFAAPWALKDITRASAQNFASVKDDLQKLDFELVTAGFPCQTFSKAGSKDGFFDDKGKGNLFFDLAAILAQVRAPIVLCENVAHLQKHQRGQTFGAMMEKLTSLGYYLKFNILNSRDFGLAQKRERLYLIAFQNRGQSEKFSWPRRKVGKQMKVADCLEPHVDPVYFVENSTLSEKIKNQHFEAGKIYLWRRNHWRVYADGVSPTLLANMGTGGHNVPLVLTEEGLRRLTPRECARLQGYPEEFVLPENLAHKHLYAQLGNSVSVPVVRALAAEIVKNWS